MSVISTSPAKIFLFMFYPFVFSGSVKSLHSFQGYFVINQWDIAFFALSPRFFVGQRPTLQALLPYSTFSRAGATRLQDLFCKLTLARKTPPSFINLRPLGYGGRGRDGGVFPVSLEIPCLIFKIPIFKLCQNAY
jgi:hypothetical protein